MKPSIPKGTRDFSSQEVAKRNYLKAVLQTAFESAGFQPIETPSFEKSATLLGKYGEEGDRLIFKILSNGEKLKKADLKALEENRLAAFFNSLSEKALRYDLTVPFARYVVQHQNDLVFHLNATKFNLFGVPIVHSTVVFKSFFNAMLTW